MATVREGEKTTGFVRVEVGSGDDITYKNRSFANISPDATDDNVRSLLTRYGALQTNSVNGIIRRDEATLISE